VVQENWQGSKVKRVKRVTFYTARAINEIEKAGDLREDFVPKILIGGGGKRMLKLAGRSADIVSIDSCWKGSWSQGVEDQTLSRARTISSSLFHLYQH
jgi:hypothetical protein